MDSWEVAPDVFCLGPSGRTQTNVYFVRSDAGWFLVDAGWQSDRARIAQAAIQLFGVGSRPENILLTHCHPDHAGAALDLARGWDREVLMHPAELPIASVTSRPCGPLPARSTAGSCCRSCGPWLEAA